MVSDDANGTLKILQRGVNCIAGIFYFGKTVLQYKARDPERVQPTGNIVTFFVGGQVFKSTAGTDYDRRAVCLSFDGR